MPGRGLDPVEARATQLGAQPVHGGPPSASVAYGQVARDLVLRVDAAPGPGRTTPVRERLEMLGGKGANQAVGMAQLGLEPVLVGVVGDDPTGGTLIDDARRSGIDVRHVVRRQGARTALIASVVDGEGWHYCEDVPDAVLVGPDDLGPVAETVATVGTIVLQLQQPQATVRSAAELARRSGGRVVLDGAPSAGDRYALLELTDVVRADAREAVGLADLTGVPVGGRDEIAGGDDAVRVAQTLLELGPSFAAVAAGPDGNAFAWP